MLDTDIASYVIRKRPIGLADKFQRNAESLCVSVMTAAELRFGAEKAGRPELVDLVESFLERLAIIDWTGSVCAHYARIRTSMERSGKLIGNMDLLIAAHAAAERMTLVTNNLRHFSQVPGLKVEVWN